jgi:alkylhydroperoxidase family enzyme
MTVVAMVEEPESAELRELYGVLDRSSQGLGVLNIFKVMAHSPELMSSWWRMMAVLLTRLELPARYRELAILRLFQVKGGAYGFAHHVRIGRQVGITDEQIATLAQYAAHDCFDARDVLVLRYTDAVTRMEGDASAIAEEVKRELGERKLVELTFCIANWNMMAHLLEPLQVELEDAMRQYLPADWRGLRATGGL